MTLLLTRSDVADLLPMDACIEAVEQAFRLHGEGLADPLAEGDKAIVCAKRE